MSEIPGVIPARRRSRLAMVEKVGLGGTAPIVVQSMTNTDTADVFATAMQVAQLARAGSELVRITVNTREAAAAVPKIRERLAQMNVDVPLIGDFHFNGHKLLARASGMCRGAGQVAHQSRQRRQGREARRTVRPADRNRLPLRQAGAHRRQLGQPRSGAAGAHHGRKRQTCRSPRMPPRSCAKRWSPRRWNRRRRPSSSAWPAIASCSRARSPACRI